MRRRARRVAGHVSIVGALLLAAAALSGCTDHFTNEGDTDAGVEDVREPVLFPGGGVGEACQDERDCRRGLACTEGSCAPTGERAADERCILTAECGDGLQCDWAGFCVAAGSGTEGSDCTTAAECQRGLVCEYAAGTAGYCEPPRGDAGDIGASCASILDCMAGLACSAGSGTCQPGSLFLNPDVFAGVTCPIEEEAELPFGVRSRVHRPDDDRNDFYRFPFPSDAYLRDGKVDISAHPTPGPGLIGFDVVQAVVDAINDEMTGFSVVPAVYFRFSSKVDQNTLSSEGNGTIRFVNLETGASVPFSVDYSAERNKYMCDNRLYVHPRWDQPLEPNTTYGVILTTDILSAADGDTVAGQNAQALDDLPDLLADSAPSDASVRRVWEAYGPLRDWMADVGLGRDRVAGATVFTTSDPTSLMSRFRDVVRAAEAPTIADGPVLCEPGVTSPCASANPPAEGADSRDCPATASSSYREYHMKVRLPVFQRGDRPYLESGGHVALEGGEPQILDTEAVCVSLTVPSGEMPDDGWPVVIYGHGTGGSFRSAVPLLADNATTLAMGDEEIQVAFVGVDGSMHGPRRGVELDPGPLFFNVRNPPAAKGNVYQGSAENFALVRFLAEFDGSLEGAGQTQFDEGNIYYHGHSQGGTTGSLFVPYEDLVKGAAFSGTGGSLVLGLLGKSEPYDASVGMRIATQEVDIDEFHPVLHLIQFYFDEIDPLHYAELLFDEPPGEPVHTLHVYGQNDSFTPPSSTRIWAAATGGTLGLPAPLPDGFDTIEDLGMESQPLPITGNVTVDGQEITGVTTEFFNDPSNSFSGDPYDGHFVIYRDRTAAAQLAAFLFTAIQDGVPTVIE